MLQKLKDDMPGVLALEGVGGSGGKGEERYFSLAQLDQAYDFAKGVG